jgi:hypothetical protein
MYVSDSLPSQMSSSVDFTLKNTHNLQILSPNNSPTKHPTKLLEPARAMNSDVEEGARKDSSISDKITTSYHPSHL